MIELAGISKSFKVAQRKKGAGAALASLFHRTYREVQALNDIAFSVGKGEIVGYIGPNGAGKSTTIKVMSGILTPDAGTCQVAGFTPWKDRRRYVQQIGVVFGQRTQLWWDVPVADSYDLLAAIYKIPKSRYADNLKLLTDTLDLGAFLHTPLRQLSLGQRMRAEIAASLLHDPQILFLDEPTIGLDAVSKLAVRRFIKEINLRRELTVILTTHDMNDIDALTDRIILIGRGKILLDGSMASMKAHFDSSRTLTITFAPHEEAIMVSGASLTEWSSQRAVYRVDTARTTVSRVLGALSQQLSIQDMTSEGCPLEETIAQLYQEHGL